MGARRGLRRARPRDDTLSILDFRGYEIELATVHLDRGYDYPPCESSSASRGSRRSSRCAGRASAASAAPRRESVSDNAGPSSGRTPGSPTSGSLRRNTDRKRVHREAALDLAAALILTTKLVKWCKRYGPVFAAA